MIQITKLPESEKISKDFKIKLNDLPAHAYVTRVSAMPFNREWPGHQRPLNQTEEASFISFAMDEPVVVTLDHITDYKDVVIRPLSKKITPVIQGKTLTFTIHTPGQYTVELDGPHKALHIFANPVEDFQVDIHDKNTIYFPAGNHYPGLIMLESNQTVYLEAGAVVYGSILAVQAENIRILGYGILDDSMEERRVNYAVPLDFQHHTFETGPIPPSQIKDAKTISGTDILQNKEDFLNFLQKEKLCRGCVQLYKCDHIEIRGPIFRDSSMYTVIIGNCYDAVCDNIKTIGMWRYNSDGIDIFNSKHCVIRNSFLRHFDDCIVIKGMVGWDTHNIEDILVENCVIWCDWGHNFEIGAETNAPEFKDITFRNCDCIHGPDYMLDIQACDRAEIHHILYDDIRVEYSRYDVTPAHQFEDGQEFPAEPSTPLLISAGINRLYFSNYYVKGNIHHITFRNIHVLTDDPVKKPKILLQCWDADHTVDTVIFENITINGVSQDLSDMLSCGPFVHNVNIL